MSLALIDTLREWKMSRAVAGRVVVALWSCVVLSADADSTSAPVNLLSNPGFEVGEGPWSAHGKLPFLDETVSYRGGASAKLVCDAPQARLSHAKLPAQPDTNYVVGGWSMSDGGRWCTYMAICYDESGNLLRLFHGGHADWDHPWTESYFVFRTPSGTAHISVQCAIKDPGTAWFDNVYLAQVTGGPTWNLLANSSFEVAVNPDTPDHWGRDLNVPPFGTEIWSTDSSTFFHGRQSLRIGAKDKYARCRLNMETGLVSTFSVFLKSDRDEARAALECTTLGRKARSKEVAVTRNWERYWVAGTAQSRKGFLKVTQLSDGCLWLDAAQLEQRDGAEPESVDAPSPYAPSLQDVAGGLTPEWRHSLLPADLRSGSARSLPPESRAEGPAPQMLELDGTEFDFYTTETEARVRCSIFASPEQLEAGRVDWRLLDEKGDLLRENRLQNPHLGPNTWAVPIQDLPGGACTISVAFSRDGTAVADVSQSFRKLPAAPHEVRINRWGRFLVVDGEPFFWYGFYCSLKGSEIESEAILKDIRSVGSTVVLNYSGYEPNISWALDQAEALGLKMWVHLQRFVTWQSPKNRQGFTEETATAALTEVMMKHRNHPALLGWCSVDEPGNRPTVFTKEYVEKWYRLIKELDPHHPCIFSHLNHLGENDVYSGSTDLALIPFTERSKHERLFRGYWDAGLALAANAPCYDAGVRVRAPTPSEQRMRMYKALVLGACGLSTYTYRPTAVETWSEFGRIGKELKILAPVLLTSEEKRRVDVRPVGGAVSALLKTHAGKTRLLVVNTASHAVDAELTLRGPMRVSKAVPMFDSVTALVDSESRRLRVNMPAQSRAVYEIKP